VMNGGMGLVNDEGGGECSRSGMNGDMGLVNGGRTAVGVQV
jgi:hypothetical protein